MLLNESREHGAPAHRLGLGLGLRLRLRLGSGSGSGLPAPAIRDSGSGPGGSPASCSRSDDRATADVAGVHGDAIDVVPQLTRLRDELTANGERLRGLVHEAAGEEFNVNSTKQLREILFERLGLTPGKKTKTGSRPEVLTPK